MLTCNLLLWQFAESGLDWNKEDNFKRQRWDFRQGIGSDRRPTLADQVRLAYKQLYLFHTHTYTCTPSNMNAILTSSWQHEMNKSIIWFPWWFSFLSHLTAGNMDHKEDLIYLHGMILLVNNEFLIHCFWTRYFHSWQWALFSLCIHCLLANDNCNPAGCDAFRLFSSDCHPIKKSSLSCPDTPHPFFHVCPNRSSSAHSHLC